MQTMSETTVSLLAINIVYASFHCMLDQQLYHTDEASVLLQLTPAMLVSIYFSRMCDQTYSRL